MNDVDACEWKGRENGSPEESLEVYAQYPPGLNSASSTPAYAFSDKAMENDFDFESAASSPNHNMPIMKSPGMPTIKHNTPKRLPPALRVRNGHQSKPSVSAGAT